MIRRKQPAEKNLKAQIQALENQVRLGRAKRAARQRNMQQAVVQARAEEDRTQAEGAAQNRATPSASSKCHREVELVRGDLSGNLGVLRAI